MELRLFLGIIIRVLLPGAEKDPAYAVLEEHPSGNDSCQNRLCDETPSSGVNVKKVEVAHVTVRYTKVVF